MWIPVIIAGSILAIIVVWLAWGRRRRDAVDTIRHRPGMMTHPHPDAPSSATQSVESAGAKDASSPSRAKAIAVAAGAVAVGAVGGVIVADAMMSDTADADAGDASDLGGFSDMG